MKRPAVRSNRQQSRSRQAPPDRGRPPPCVMVDLRRVRRPDQAQADSRALQPAPRAACCRTASRSSALARDRCRRRGASARKLLDDVSELRRPRRSTDELRAGSPTHLLRARRLRRSRPPTRAWRSGSSAIERARHRGQHLFYLAMPAGALRADRRAAGRAPGSPTEEDGRLAARGRREAVRPRPRVGARAQPQICAGASTSSRSTASITTSARRPSRT